MAQPPPLEKIGPYAYALVVFKWGHFCNVDAKHKLHKLYHFTILGQYIAMGYVYYCANNGLPILPILIYLYWHNIGKSILVQNRKQRWVNIVTNIGAIYARTTVFQYCANNGLPILCQYRQTIIGPTLSPILHQCCLLQGDRYGQTDGQTDRRHAIS